MASDTQWVEDVQRWVAAARPHQGKPVVASTTSAAPPNVCDSDMELGYEAANPALQAAHWPDTPTPVKGASQ